MPSTDSGVPEKVDAMLSEQVVGMARNEWTASIGIDGRHGPEHANTPLVPHPKLKPLFFTSCRTVSCEMLSTTCSATKRSARSCSVHRFRPSGGLLWASVSRTASPFLSSFFCAPGRGRSLSAPSRLPSTNRCRVRCTVAVPVCNASDISRSLLPSSASSSIRARSAIPAIWLFALT